jgi:hypothetical protein
MQLIIAQYIVVIKKQIIQYMPFIINPTLQKKKARKMPQNAQNPFFEGDM